MRSRVAFARHPQPRALLRSRRDPHFHGFGGRDAAVARASRALLRSRPVPSQRGQVRLKRIAPATWVTLPLPLHSGQTVLAPARVPVPPQVAQASWREIFRRTCVPLIACQKSIFRPYSRSAPFSGAAAAALACWRPNHWLKIS